MTEGEEVKENKNKSLRRVCNDHYNIPEKRKKKTVVFLHPYHKWGKKNILDSTVHGQTWPKLCFELNALGML